MAVKAMWEGMKPSRDVNKGESVEHGAFRDQAQGEMFNESQKKWAKWSAWGSGLSI